MESDPVRIHQTIKGKLSSKYSHQCHDTL